MRKTHRHVPVALVLILGFGTSSCLVRGIRPIKQHGKKQATPQTLLVATRDELNTRIANIYNAISSFQATVEMTPSVGSVYKGKITEYQDVHSYVLFRKPSDIRVIGQLPVVRTTAFDMVSNGASFKIFLQTKGRFLVGDNSAPANSKNTLENLRPEAFLASMLIRPADPATEKPALEDATDEDNAFYVLHFITTGSDGYPHIARNVWFDRLDLSLVRQKVLDESGTIVSDTRYAKWTPYNAVMFPANIDINRPKDGYGVVMTVEKMDMNVKLGDEKFVLNPPEGIPVQALGSAKTVGALK